MRLKFQIILACLFLLSIQLKAQAPNALNYQGVARNSLGAVIAKQAIGLQFTIIQGSPSGTTVYQETDTATTNQFGLFTVAIGEGIAGSYNFSAIAWDANREYLQVGMDPTGGTSYTNMGTQQLLSVPYALFAEKSGGVASSPWTTIGNYIYNNNSGNVGIGTTTPATDAEVDVQSSHTYGAIFGTDTVTGGTALYGYANAIDDSGYGAEFLGGYEGSENIAIGKTAGGQYYGSFSGVISSAASYNYGAYDYAQSTDGYNYGVTGVAADGGLGSSYGVFGSASSTTGLAYGLYGEGAPIGGYAFAKGNGVTNAYLDSVAYTNTRVIGFDGEVTGGTGSNVTTENDGVLGVATNPDAQNNVGTFSYASGAKHYNYGSYSVAQATPASYYTFCIYTDLNPSSSVSDTSQYNNYAAYFYNDSSQATVYVDGDLSAANKLFKIDDPLDPANKYLYHDCVESPDMINLYNGDIITDANGNATVALPQYFQAENKDFKYQLTVIGQFAQAIVATKVNNNQFTIKTDKPNVEVSWQVTGVRQDPYANRHRTVAEVEKKGIEKGHYLFPQYYGQPETMSIGYLMSAVNKNNSSSAALTVHNPVATPQRPTLAGNANATQLH